ncbi:hypothetical protein BS47DRAFT_104052 [Hydnum rufescens UP504]|uniref:Uncharacterized protein n=1 Tax=Hydnum rufescens UP504 TaxID=1448309 RepID=A0A9P6AQF4_9AGAM|nr:hypothetical protein BS47DRAFT_104052 [Hydnum rufescens UP504]
MRSLTLHIASPQFSLPSYTLPHLSHIVLLQPQHSNIARGRPVTSVVQRNLTEDDYTLFADNLAASSVPITRLEAYFSSTRHFQSPKQDNDYDRDHDHSPTSNHQQPNHNNPIARNTAYSSIIARLPFLRFLKITQERMPSVAFFPRACSFNVLARFTPSFGDYRVVRVEGARREGPATFLRGVLQVLSSVEKGNIPLLGREGSDLEKRGPNAEWNLCNMTRADLVAPLSRQRSRRADPC